MRCLFRILIIAAISTLTSCKNSSKPKLDHSKKNNKAEVVRDTSLVVIQDLPVEIDSLNHIIHVVGEPRSSVYQSSYVSSEPSLSGSQFSLVNSYNGGFSGKIFNLKFQKIDTGEITELTNEVILISSFNYLRNVEEQNQGSYFIYTVYDADLNGDHTVDAKDLKSLYLSKSDGKNFNRVSPENQELIDWNYIKVENRVYFRTVEDINRDGLFENSDTLHYFYIDFDTKPLTSIEYQ